MFETWSGYRPVGAPGGTGYQTVFSALLMLLALVVVLPSAFVLMSNEASAQEQQRQQERTRTRAGQNGESNQRADFWRVVREGNSGYSAVRGPESNVLIQGGGENWRALRNGPFKTFGAWMLAGTLLMIVLLLLIFGTMKLEHGRSGMTIPRWNVFFRFLHWYTAILFLILMLTGLTLLYGRYLLIPVIGKDAFAAFANVAKSFHDYLGPFFTVGLVLELLLWLRHNIPNARDFEWFKQGGGLLKGKHPDAGRMNGGEKLWYWVLLVFGLATAVSGLMMDFPNMGWTREQMQIANLVHVGSGFVLMCFALGHIYAGIATPGAIEGMTTGRVDVEWARQHHNLWYHEMMDKGVEPTPASESAAAKPSAPPSGATT